MRNILLLLVSVTIVAALTESVMRVMASRERARIHNTLDETELCTVAAKDRRLIYTYVPGKCGTNSQGYFDVEHAFEKPEGVFRLVIIGDSVAQGRDVGRDEVFGRVLEQLLNARGDGRVYEVIILARIGYSTSQEIVLLESEAFRYAPDLILWSYCLNDPAHPVYHNANGSLGRYYYRPRLYLASLVDMAWFRVQRKLRGSECSNEFHKFLHCAYEPEIERDIQTIHDLAQQNDTPVAIVIHPIFEPIDTFDDYSLSEVHEWLRSVASQTGLVPIDVLAALRGRRPDDLKIHRAEFYDPWHYNAAGNRITAEYIGDMLSAQSLLDAN